MRSIGGVLTGSGKQKYSEKYTHCEFDHHKSHMDYCRSEAGDEKREVRKFNNKSCTMRFGGLLPTSSGFMFKLIGKPRDWVVRHFSCAL